MALSAVFLTRVEPGGDKEGCAASGLGGNSMLMRSGTGLVLT